MNEEFIIVLANGKPVLNKLSTNLGFIEKNDIEFFPSGMVKRFKFKGIFYIALFYTDSNKLFAYYFNETEFNYRKSAKGVVTLNTSNLEFIFKPEWFINAKTSHNGLPIEVEREYNHDDNLCIARYQLIYNFSTHNYNQNDTVPFPPNYDHSGSVCFSSTNPLMKFYSAHVNRPEIEKKVLTDIAFLLNKYKDSDLLQVLEEKNMLSLWDNQNISWADQTALSKYYSYTNDDFIKYRNWLERYYLQFKYNREKINTLTDARKIYIAADFFDAIALKQLTVDEKIIVFDVIAKGNDMHWWDNLFKEQKMEPLLIRLVKSIKDEQTDDFLTKFEKYLQPIYSYADLSKEDKKTFVVTLYDIWIRSSFNPYQNGTFNESNFQRYIYSKKVLATCPDYTNPSFYDFNDSRVFNYNAAPIVLDYHSTSIAGIYFDNFRFLFSSDSSEGGELDDFEFEFRFFKNVDDSPKDKILAIKDKYTKSGDDALYGTYGYYQPVSLIDTNQQAIIRIPVIGGNGSTTTVAGHPEKINSLIPIFVLKYIDDAGDESDFYKSLGYAVDIASIFIGGYGFLTKLGHLRKLSGFTEAIVTGSDYGRKVIVSLRAATVLEAVSLTSGTISFLLKLSGDTYKNQPWFTKMTTVVTWIELFSAAGSIVSELALKNATKDLVVDFNGNGWPSEFTSDARGARARKTLQDIALIDDLPILNQKLKEKLEALFDSDAANISIWQKFSALSDAKKADFHFDFRQVKKTTLIALNNEPELIDAWAELIHLRKFSANLDFLRAFRFIAKDARCAEFRLHIVNGEIKAGKAQGFHTILGQNNGKAQIIEVVEEANTKGYYKAIVQVLNPNPPPPYIVKRIGKNGDVVENDMFPDNWDANKIFEEVSYAFTNKNRELGTYNQWRGLMSDGNPCIICINNTAHIIDGTTEIKTAWPIKTF